MNVTQWMLAYLVPYHMVTGSNCPKVAKGTATLVGLTSVIFISNPVLLVQCSDLNLDPNIEKYESPIYFPPSSLHKREKELTPYCDQLMNST